MKYPKMRRYKQELSERAAYKIIEKAKYGVLSLCDEGAPYGVPLSAALSGSTLYFHCAHQGLKLDIIAKNPKGHFVFVSKAKTVSQKATVDYKSAMAYGTLRIVEGAKERKKAYNAIVNKYMKKYLDEAAKIIQKSDTKTTLVAMDIEGISAKGSSKKKTATISTSIEVNGHQIKNRIVMPPLVRLQQKRKKGMLSKDDYEHYISRAKYGTGLIVVEATTVDKNGLAFENGLRLWADKHVGQFKKLTAGCKKHGAVVLVQLIHGGFKSDKKLTSPVSASDYDDGKKKAKKLTAKETDALVESFAQAALRAQKAGFDGVQLHGCHEFLINQFSCPAVNKRSDKYAKSSAFGVSIIKRIKELCSKDFIISVRVGIDSPTTENSIQTAIDYQNAGAHMLSVSAGIYTKPFSAPKDWEYSNVSYLAYLVKQRVDVPVVGVYGITSPKQANGILKNNYFDMVSVGRNHLIHADWAHRALKGKKISKCRHCKKGCYFFGSLKKCPAIEIAKKDGLL